MKFYTVYFEVFGKKLKQKVRAIDKQDAMDKVRDVKFKFYKVESEDEEEANQKVDDLLKHFGIK